MRVGIVAWLQESNTFITGRTTLAHYEQDLLAEGAEVRRRMGDAHHEVGGFFAGLDAARLKAVPVFAARALPYGVMDDTTFRELVRRMDRALDRAEPLDGILVAPHGATVSEQVPDVDGFWLDRLRARFGPQVPIIGTLDLHANVSREMVTACDALIAYRTNPHLDQRARGIEAAQLMARTLRGEVRPTLGAALLPLAVNIERQLTAELPCRQLYEWANAQLRLPGVLSNSVVLGFPYADVAELGATVLVVTDNDTARAQDLATELATAWWQRRAEFEGQFVAVDEAVARVARLDGPVCLLDMGDNVGGGSPADGTWLAHAICDQRVGPALVCLYDPDAARQARQAGIGAQLTLSVGGKSDDRHGPPLVAEFRVTGLFDGRFQETQPRHGGITDFDQGASVVLETATGLTVLLNSRRMAPFSLNQLISCGLDPARFQILVAKGVHAPVAAYAPVCRYLIRVDTPGVTRADLRRLEYNHRRRPMWPFESNATWPQRPVLSQQS